MKQKNLLECQRRYIVSIKRDHAIVTNRHKISSVTVNEVGEVNHPDDSSVFLEYCQLLTVASVPNSKLSHLSN